MVLCSLFVAVCVAYFASFRFVFLLEEKNNCCGVISVALVFPPEL